MATLLLVIILALVVTVALYLKWCYGYFQRQNIPYIRTMFPLGMYGTMYAGDFFKYVYDEFKAKGYKYGGTFILLEPVYVPTDIECIKNCLQLFNNRGFYYNEKDDPLSLHLISLTGARWKRERTKLTPAFSSGKLRIMFHTMLACGEQLVGHLIPNELFDVKDTMARFTMDVIGSCAFGIECNSFKSPDSDFRRYANRCLNITRTQAIKLAIAKSSWKLARLMGLTVTGNEERNFFLQIVKENMEHRTKHGLKRKDLMQILIDLQDDMEFHEITAHMFSFFLAGFETTASSLTFCLFELAVNPNVQEKARREVNAIYAKCNGRLTYDAVNEMNYVLQIINETLRKYPPIGAIGRSCNKDFRIPESDVVIPKGVRVIIPVKALHHDCEYFTNPEIFDPDRFSDGNLVPHAYIPFGNGPRHCIGTQFGVMQMKIAVATLLRNFRFSLNMKTRVPLHMEPFNIVMTVRGAIWLNVTKL